MKEEDIRKREVFNKYLQLVTEDAKNFFSNTVDFEEIKCPACGSGNFENEFSKVNFIYVLCKDCGTLFVNPRPTVEKIKDFYAASPSSVFWVEEFFKPVAEIRREKIFKPRAEYIKYALPEMHDKTIGDIGAGFGIFLEEMKKVMPDNRYIAIEPSLDMAKICENKGIDVITDMLENIGDEHKDSFFLLTAFELFEHLCEPEYFLEKIYELLKPGGYIYITTLNGEGFDIQVLWDKSKSIFPPHHLNFFNPSSLNRLLEKTGFIVEDTATPGVLDWSILEGAYKKENADITRLWKLVADKGTEKMKNELQQWISNNNLSSHMRILAKKPE